MVEFIILYKHAKQLNRAGLRLVGAVIIDRRITEEFGQGPGEEGDQASMKFFT
jgi:hypothetical protein